MKKSLISRIALLGLMALFAVTLNVSAAAGADSTSAPAADKTKVDDGSPSSPPVAPKKKKKKKACATGSCSSSTSSSSTTAKTPAAKTPAANTATPAPSSTGGDSQK